MQISEGTVATFRYTLTDAAGEVLDASAPGQAMPYLHGASNIVPGLEQALEGRSAGDTFEVAVLPEDGYGPHHPELVQVVPRQAFQGVDNLSVGMQFQAGGAASDGDGMMVVVTALDGDNVTVDGNHPLAGQTLHFAIEVEDVRAATEEETQHGHVHGAGGHHH